MKKIVLLLTLCALVLSLAACSGGGSDSGSAGDTPAAPAPTATPDMSDILTASGTNIAGSKTPPASGTDIQAVETPQQDTVTPLDQEAYQKALTYIGQDVQELYNAIGQPAETPTYGPSCLIQGAEDGMLNYTGFYVWTIRTDSGETVHEVYPDA